MTSKKYSKVNLTSSNLTQEKLAELKKILPDVFREEKIDWDKLRAVLGDEINLGPEKFKFTWSGKTQAIKNVLVPSTATLKPAKEESIKFDESENLFIEGDNLEVLKLLQKAYFEQVKMIYIDPPYNTGGDFVYQDDFKTPLKNYLEQTGQKDDNGNKLQTNRESSGRYHSDWLSMMYPRLKLAWNLLKDDGVIFISIDDNEVHHLRMLMDEIFGEENFQGHIHWRRRHNQPNDPTKMIGLVAEHIIVYAKDSSTLKTNGVGKVELTGKFSNPDNDPRGNWASKPWKVGSGQSGSRYKITTLSGNIYDEEWMGEEKTFKNLLTDNRIIFPDNGKGAPRKKYFESEREAEGQCATNWWSHEIFGSNQDGSNELFEIFGVKDIFDNPKPTKLLKNIARLSKVEDGDLVLDFFGGSSTLAQAIMNFNENNSTNIKYILVQLPEPLNPNKKEHKTAYDFCIKISKPTNVAEIAKERIRRVIKGYGKDLKPIDDGFKVFKLDKSNYPENNFEYDPEKNEEENKQAFEVYLSKAKQSVMFKKTNELDVVYENIIKEGLSLNSKIKQIKITDNNFYQVRDESQERQLLICLESKIAKDTINELISKTYKEKTVILLDDALDDSNKANLALNVELKTI